MPDDDQRTNGRRKEEGKKKNATSINIYLLLHFHEATYLKK